MFGGGKKGVVPKGLKPYLNAKKKALNSGESGFSFTKANGTTKHYKFKKAKSGMVIAKEVNKNGKFINKPKKSKKSKKN